MDMQLQGRRALVCGGSAGIGLGCARALAEEGVSLVIAARDQARLDAAVARLAVSGGEVRGVSVDLSHADAHLTLRKAVAEVDILVTNPGGSPAADILVAGEAWSDGISQIVTRPMALIDVYLPGMRARGFGRVINITSSAFAIANPAVAFSGALRAALTHAAANIARRVAPDGVTVNNLAPGPVESAALDELFERLGREQGASAADIRARRLQDTPTHRFADPLEIGRMVAFLASPHAANLTGRTVLMDGGANTYPFL